MRRPDRLFSGLAVLLTAQLLVGCPYDAAIEPSGGMVRLHPGVVGLWSCRLDGEEWVNLLIGQTSDGLYHLVLRPSPSATPAPDEQFEGPLILYARPRRIGPREVWSLWSEDVDDPGSKFSFARLDLSAPHRLRLAVLGGEEGSLTGTLDITEPDQLAQLLAGPKTVVESTVDCGR